MVKAGKGGKQKTSKPTVNAWCSSDELHWQKRLVGGEGLEPPIRSRPLDCIEKPIKAHFPVIDNTVDSLSG